MNGSGRSAKSCCIPTCPAGMNEKVGLLSYRLDQDAFDKPYSDETAHMVDTEVNIFTHALLPDFSVAKILHTASPSEF